MLLAVVFSCLDFTFLYFISLKNITVLLLIHAVHSDKYYKLIIGTKTKY